MTSVIAALERLGEIEWYSVRPAELVTANRPLPTFPPIITFRFKDGNRLLYKRLEDSLRSYAGSVRWVVSGKDEKNLCLLPERLCQTALGGMPMLDVVDSIIESDPSFIDLAGQDFAQLVMHLENSL